MHKISFKGFTLIELLVVIAIIGVLSSVILTSLNTAKQKANDAIRLSNLKEIQKALIVYYDNNGHYPIQTGWTGDCVGFGGVAANNTIPGLVPSYIPTFPSDPDLAYSSNGNCLIYLSNASGSDYKLLDYNLLKYANGAAAGPMIDPKRNIGRAWAVSGVCAGGADTSVVWAIWSSPTSMCW